jgi:hypothetical protein
VAVRRVWVVARQPAVVSVLPGVEWSPLRLVVVQVSPRGEVVLPVEAPVSLPAAVEQQPVEAVSEVWAALRVAVPAAWIHLPEVVVQPEAGEVPMNPRVVLPAVEWMPGEGAVPRVAVRLLPGGAEVLRRRLPRRRICRKSALPA